MKATEALAAFLKSPDGVGAESPTHLIRRLITLYNVPPDEQQQLDNLVRKALVNKVPGKGIVHIPSNRHGSNMVCYRARATSDPKTKDLAKRSWGQLAS